MKAIVLALFLAAISAYADAAVVYEQPPNAAGGFFHSSWWDPDGSNYDEYVWDRFVLASDAVVDTIAWRGAYDGTSTPVYNFWVGVYGSIPGGSEPDVANPPLFEYETGDNCGETYAGVYGGVTMYDYRFALPVSFHAQAGVPYWVQIEGWQASFPKWSLAKGTGGDGSHFRCLHTTLAPEGGVSPSTNVPTGCTFNFITGDVAFRLLATGPSAVEDVSGPAVLKLEGAFPNPSPASRLNVLFRLPSDAPARLALFDAGGRQVAVQEVGSGAGSHVINLAEERAIPPGLYFVRLSQGPAETASKVVITR